MGKSIVIHKSPDNAGKRSWLWLSEDIDHVLTKNKGTDAIQGIVQETHRPYKGHWDPNAFKEMINLKLLILRSWDLPLGLTCLSEGLKYLEWEEFPLKELPLGVQLNDLVELTMQHSKIKQLWLGTKNFGKLKLIDLKYSKDIKQFPSVSGVPCLELLVLEGCINLVEVHQSVGLHKKLMVLNLRNCVNLETLPSKLEMDSLKNFILSGCSKVKKLPEFGGNTEFLSKLDLKDCKSLLCLPGSIMKLKSLKILNTSGCSKLSRLPENLDKNESLEELIVSGTAIREVPSCISHLKYLKKLSLSGHKVTKSNSSSLSFPLQWMFGRRRVSTGILLPPLSSFSFLEELDLSYCDLTDESLPVDLGCLSSLRKLDISGNNFINLPASCIASLSKLYYLKLDCCPRLESVPMLPPHIEYLYGINCTSWKPLSDPQYLCYFLKSYQKMRSGYQPFWIFPRSDIPPWFSNQNYFQQELRSSFRRDITSESDYSRDWGSAGMHLSGACHSMMSIIVDIPQFCLSSEWWGIAVCLVLENQFLPSPWFVPTLEWICKTPESDTPSPSASSYVCWFEEFSGSHLCILLLNGFDRNIQQQLRADQNQIQLSFYAQAIPRGSDYSSLLYLNISKCGCRVLCKEDLEEWRKEWGQQQQGNNFEIHSSSLNKCRAIQDMYDNQCCDGFEEEHATTSNAEPKRRKLGMKRSQ
ncbi:hypothetical protein L6164_031623 [Bauhinia variegata]|uniref:Uncharacterized protein n=1 Tax=Bauhinia variegata TaxID=167791 RepID=A0ACB9LHK4_BAUVA|nr:hypothetical protein L6164_031623 [Bauhinia variegata]